jgi:hypothetical protein
MPKKHTFFVANLPAHGRVTRAGETPEEKETRMALHAVVETAASKVWDNLSQAQRRKLVKLPRTTFDNLKHLKATGQQDVFCEVQVLDEKHKEHTIDRMLHTGRFPADLTDGQPAGDAQMLGIIIRTIHRFVNDTAQRGQVLPRLDTLPRSLESIEIGGVPRLRLITEFLHNSHRSYWAQEQLVRAHASVAQAVPAVRDALVELSGV